MNKTPPANIAFVSGVSSVSDSVPPATSKSSAQSAALANNSVPPTAQNNPAASTAANSSGPPASAGSSVPPPRKSSLTKFLKRLPIINQLRISIGLQRGMLIAGLTMVVIFVLTAVFAPVLAPYSYNQMSDASGELFGAQLPPGTNGHILGTTVSGYDVLSRVIWGAQTAFLAIIIAVALSTFVGIFLGLLSGYFGGVADRILVLITDAIYSFPSLLLAIVMAIAISRGESNLWGGLLASGISITVIFIPQYFRVVRAEAVRVKSELFVDAAKVMGVSTRKILFTHILRNSTRSLPVIFTLNSSEAILTLAGLGFLGFGIEPTSAAEWGYDLNRAMGDLTSGFWWTAVFPGLAIVFVVLGVTLVGESLNDLADPRLRQRLSGEVANANENDPDDETDFEIEAPVPNFYPDAASLGEISSGVAPSSAATTDIATNTADARTSVTGAGTPDSSLIAKTSTSASNDSPSVGTARIEAITNHPERNEPA